MGNKLNKTSPLPPLQPVLLSKVDNSSKVDKEAKKTKKHKMNEFAYAMMRANGICPVCFEAGRYNLDVTMAMKLKIMTHCSYYH